VSKGNFCTTIGWNSFWGSGLLVIHGWLKHLYQGSLWLVTKRSRRSTPTRTRDFYYRFEKRWSRGRRPRGLGWKGAKKRQKRIQWYYFPSGLCNPSTLKWTTCISLSVRPIPGPSLSLRGQWLRQAYLDRGLLIWQHKLHQNTCLINDYTRNLFASATCAHSSSITLECALQSQTLLHPHCWSFSKLKFKSFFGHPIFGNQTDFDERMKPAWLIYFFAMIRNEQSKFVRVVWCKARSLGTPRDSPFALISPDSDDMKIQKKTKLTIRVCVCTNICIHVYVGWLAGSSHLPTT